MWAVIPVKDLGRAKGRLKDVLDAPERRALFRLMLADVLESVSAAAGLAGVAVVSRDPEAAAIARRHGCRVLPEAANRGQSAAVAAGAAALGTAGIIAIPGDVPLVEPSEIEAVLAAHGQAPAVTIVPSRDGRGTNGLACSPPDAIPFHFGDDSFRRHLAEARHRGIEPRVLRLPGLALDIDTAEDVRALLDRPAHTRAQRFLDDRGVAARLGAGVESRPDREAEPLVTGEVA